LGKDPGDCWEGEFYSVERGVAVGGMYGAIELLI